MPTFSERRDRETLGPRRARAFRMSAPVSADCTLRRRVSEGSAMERRFPISDLVPRQKLRNSELTCQCVTISAAEPTMTSIDETHDPSLTSWVASANGHADFPIQNLPFGIFVP